MIPCKNPALIVGILLCTGAFGGGPAMTVEIQLDGVSICKTSFSLCAARRGPIVQEPRQTISFSFRPNRTILWMYESGVTVKPIQTKPDQWIKGSIRIWQPDADSGWPTIGAYFYSEDRILMRAIHIAHPKKRDRSEIAAGLVLWTYPAKREK